MTQPATCPCCDPITGTGLTATCTCGGGTGMDLNALRARLDLDVIQARANAVTDPSACGTCRRHAAAGQPVEHDECARRATLLGAPDAPCYETILDTPEDQRAQLPARFHTPVYSADSTPKGWHCAVCWGDGWGTQWPCKAAVEHGNEVFTPEHLAERARADLPKALAEVRRLTAERDQARAELAGMTDLRDRAIARQDTLRAELAELKLTPRERANRHVRALLDAGDHEGACAAAEAYEASEAYDLAHPRV